MDKTKELDAMLSDGPVVDILKAEQALKIFSVVGAAATEVNGSTFAEFFSASQGHAVEQFVLAVTRLHERERRGYPVNSLPSVVQFLIDNADSLKAQQPVILERELQEMGIWTPAIAALGPADRTRAIGRALLALIPTHATSPALNALKTLRDKRIAHRENIPADQIPKTTWEPAEKLLELPLRIVSVLGCYTNVMYSADGGHYFLSGDAEQAATCLRRILRELKITKPLFGETS